MSLAGMSASGEITVPLPQNQNGEIAAGNASAAAIRQAQSAFAGVADAIGVSNEDDVQALVNEVRYGNSAADID